jgi:hypothetical protein
MTRPRLRGVIRGRGRLAFMKSPGLVSAQYVTDLAYRLLHDNSMTASHRYDSVVGIGQCFEGGNVRWVYEGLSAGCILKLDEGWHVLNLKR